MFDVLVNAFVGGLVIGLAALLLLLFNGRIAGICGIFSNLFLPQTKQRLWRALFIAGLLTGAWACHALTSVAIPEQPIRPLWLLITSGLLVGFGTQMGSGCTSGHSVCGIARFSPRSFIATCTFMGAGFVTVFLLRHIAGIV